MIYKIEFKNKDDEGTFTMLFGNSYKKWYTQLNEFIYRFYTPDGEGWRWEYIEDKIVKVQRSRSNWIGWGGLKWCREDVFQQELNREGCQDNEPDNPTPRKFSDMVFEPVTVESVYRKLRSIY